MNYPGSTRRAALMGAIRPQNGTLTPNGAPMGFGQPLSGKDQPEDLGADFKRSQNTGITGGYAPQPQAQPSQPQAPQSTMPSFGANTPVTQDAIAQYYASRGVNPRAAAGNNPSSVDYWTQKAPELVARGKELGYGNDGWDYYNKFLSNAEEFTGSPEATAMAMWGTPYPNQQQMNAPRMNMALSDSIAGPVTNVTQDSGNSFLQNLLAQLQLGIK